MKVRISGAATISIRTTVEMDEKDYNELSARIAADDADAFHDVLVDYADLGMRGDLDDLEIDEFKPVA